MKTCIIILLSTFLFSCASTKDSTVSEKVTTSEVQDDTAEREKNLSEAGFVKAIVINKKGENNCGYLLKTTDNQLYIPVSWIVPEYKVEGKEVYVKYTTSKSTQNGCTEATPIIVHEMKLLR